MNSTAYAMLLLWPLLALIPFSSLAAHRATALVVVLGWLLLPNAGINFPGLPNYTKWTAMALGLGAGTLIFHAERLATFRLSLVDVPVLLWILGAIGSSITNGYGIYDGMSAAFSRALSWGLPWIAGRIHFRTSKDLEDLLVILVAAALAHMPLVLWEVRMSPHLHRMVYGFAQHSFAQTQRGGGWRPMVFTDHGLALSLFNGCAAVAALALHRLRPRVAGVPVLAAFFLLAGLTVLCKSMGALFLMVLGIVLLLVPLSTPAIGVLLSLPVAYMLVRLFQPSMLDDVLNFIGVLSVERMESLAYRWRCEDLLADIGWRKPWFGVTTRGYATYDEYGQPTQVVTDSLWIISFVGFGIFGLVGSIGMFLVSSARGLFDSVRQVARTLGGGERGLGVILLLVTADCLVNAFATPVWILLAGALCAPRTAVAGQPSAQGAAGAAGAAAELAMAAQGRLTRREERNPGPGGDAGGRLRSMPLQQERTRERST
ncbi:MAG: hypothetical protein RIT25_1913 [Planctomycetota bacterium]